MLAAQVATVTPSEPPEPRLALIIANSGYAGALRLDRPQQDGDAIKSALESVGFRVARAYDVDRRGIERAVSILQDDLRKAGPQAIGFVYYAGHGGANRSRGVNFMVPIDATSDDVSNIEKLGVSLDWIMEMLRKTGNRANIIVFDACRTPLGTRGASRPGIGSAPIYGWANVREMQDILVAFAQAEDKPAKDDGAYAEALAASLRKHGLTLEQAFEEVQIAISTRSNGQQRPFVQDGIVEKLCLVSCTDALTADRALQVLKIAQDGRPKGDVGQREALQRLITSQRSFEGFDFDGLSFSEAELAQIKAPQASFRLSNLAGAKLLQADLSRSWLSLTNLERSVITQANVTRSVFEFALARGLIAQRVTAPRSTWFGAELEGADFSRADLRGASFVFADLRNADFSEADLTNAFFNGADLRGARFKNAKFLNTDVTSALISLEQLSKEQRNAICATVPRGFRLSVDEKFESSRSRSGYEFNEMLSAPLRIRIGAERIYPRCTTKAKEEQPLYQPPNDGSAWSIDYHMRFDRTLLGKAGRHADVMARIGGFGNMLQERLVLYDKLPQVRAFRDELFAALRQRASAPIPKSLVGIDLASEDGLLLLLYKLAPTLVGQVPVDWRKQLFARLNLERSNETRREPDTRGDRWGRLFPERFTHADIDEEAIEIYRAWTARRAESIGSVALVRLIRVKSSHPRKPLTWADAIGSQQTTGLISEIASRLQLGNDRWSPTRTNPFFEKVWVMLGIDRPLGDVLAIENKDLPAGAVTARFKAKGARYFDKEKVISLDLELEGLERVADVGRGR
jgi:uncharacterized protein YjbI with pentapeptide repeats